ncbi:MAG: type II toxin-antitoxin system VapC family toxin [Nitrospirota bacterium]|nr:type II toxin-antitoxin system VapC family toxin [Nitrospirota bacterium]
MAKSYVLDTSAIFTLTKAEDGSEVVEDILNLAKKGKNTAYLSFASFMELYYVTWQGKGEDAAKELIILVKALPVHIVDSNERITLSAGRIKANHRLSVADAFIAATAIDKNAVLVHKDPELEVISKYTETLELPYK